jgi:hypothetical protein
VRRPPAGRTARGRESDARVACGQDCPRYERDADVPGPPRWDKSQEHDWAPSPVYNFTQGRCWWARTTTPVYEWQPYACRYPVLSDAEIGQCLRRVGVSSAW